MLTCWFSAQEAHNQVTDPNWRLVCIPLQKMHCFIHVCLHVTQLSAPVPCQALSLGAQSFQSGEMLRMILGVDGTCCWVGPQMLQENHNRSAYADKGVTVLPKVRESEYMLVKPIIGEHYCSARGIAPRWPMGRVTQFRADLPSGSSSHLQQDYITLPKSTWCYREKKCQVSSTPCREDWCHLSCVISMLFMWPQLANGTKEEK